MIWTCDADGRREDIYGNATFKKRRENNQNEYPELDG